METTPGAGGSATAHFKTILLIVSAAAVAVAIHALPAAFASLRSSIFFIGIAGVLILASPYWIDKSSSHIALSIVVIVGVAALVLRVPLDAYSGIARYQSTIELLVGVSLLRKVFVRSRLDATLATWAARVAVGWRAPLLCALSCLLAAPLSVGAVAILCASLDAVVRPKTATAVVSMRAVGA